MKKLQYEAPELRIALTEYEIRTADIYDSFDDGLNIPGEEITENDN